MRNQSNPSRLISLYLLLLCCCLPGLTRAQARLWGLTSAGGTYNGGAMISLNTDGTDFQAVPFFKAEGAYPTYGHLIQASNGKFYGMTREGGSSNAGVLFEYDPAGGGTYTVKHHFTSSTGQNPYGSLIESGGKFYGMTREGGSSNAGVLFEYDPAGGGTYTVKHHFTTSTGRYPYGSLLEWGGKFYGMTYTGGSSDYGVLFEYDPAGGGTYTVKHHFTTSTGRYPYGSLLESGGKFYGMTPNGGSSNYGVLFEYDPAGGGTYTVKHHFTISTGRNPYGSLIESGGRFYGMTNRGGSLDYGVLFEYDPAGSGTYTVKHHFTSSMGRYPYGSLLESGGKFYGMAIAGGSSDHGVLFEYDPVGGGSYSVKHHFTTSTGRYPYGSLLESGGKFYGMTPNGGSSNVGVLFEYDPAGGGTYTVKVYFNSSLSGTVTYGSLLESGGKFYGMTYRGGSSDAGVLFEYDPAGSGTYTVKHHFTYSTGQNPYGSLIESGGKFYGMTREGGSSNVGVLFEYDPAGGGTYTVKHHFTSSTGRNPYGSLIESGGKFYGMTYRGGSSDAGVLFEYDPAGGGAYSVRHHFTSSTGTYPYGSLIESGGKFYGMAFWGGSSNAGVLFEYDPAGGGAYSVRHHFTSSTGTHPYGSLVESGGKFYGMTHDIFSPSYGVLFEYDPAGSGAYAVKHNFTSSTGIYPYGSLTESGGKFYGMTYGGGSSSAGVVFEYDPAGSSYTVLKHLGGADGANPQYGHLIAVSCAAPAFSACPATPVTANTDGGLCTADITYSVATDGSPAATMGYEFAGATTGSGSGTGSGETFNKGSTTVTVSAENTCGTETCVFTVTVTDNEAPTVTCPVNQTKPPTLSTPCSAVVNSIDATYDDNCTPTLSYALSGVTTGSGSGQASGQTFLVGTTTVTYTVTDGALNSSCMFTVTVTNCNIEFSGQIEWSDDQETGVNNVTVNVTGAGTGSDLSDVNGDYLASVPYTTGTFIITPVKNTNKLNGITSADATAIQQHITGAAPITNPYRMIAADVNKSNSITTADATVINQALLGSPSALAQFKTSWRFVPQTHTMSMPPWGFPEKITLTGVSSNQTGKDFFGIKTGDLVSVWTNPSTLGAGEPLVLRVQDQVLQAGSEIEAEFRADQLNDLAAWQFALRFDPEQLQLAVVQPLPALPLTLEDFGLLNISEGEIRTAWSQAAGLALEEAAPVFRLKFNVLQSGGKLSDALQLADGLLPGRVYNSALAESGVELHFSESTQVGPNPDLPSLCMYASPNPFARQTTLHFELPEAGEAELRVHDTAGRLLFSMRKYYSAGIQKELLELDESAVGVLFVELLSSGEKVTRRLIHID